MPNVKGSKPITPLHVNDVRIPISGVERRMVFTNGSLRAVEAATCKGVGDLYGNWQALLSASVISALDCAGVNAAARQDGTAEVTSDEVDDGLDVADYDKVIALVGEGLGKAIGVNIPNVLTGLRALVGLSVDAISERLAAAMASSTATGAGSTSEETPNSTGD